jgi:hypothetical protein
MFKRLDKAMRAGSATQPEHAVVCAGVCKTILVWPMAGRGRLA